ncbi:MAG: uroporphyrinogen decarboxylase family protein [Verrucomicrobiota bacterium]
MEKRENLLRTVRFEQPEYIPMVFHINASCWHHYRVDALQDLMEAHPFLFPDFKRSIGLVEPDFPPFTRAGEPFVDPWGCVWETSDSGIIGAVVKHPLETWDAFAGYCPPDPDKTTHWGAINWEAEAEIIGPAVSQTCLSNGEIGHNHTWLKLTDIRGYQNAVFDMVDGEPRLFRLLEMLEHFNAGLVHNYIKFGRVEWLGFAEDLGMQQGPMLSLEHFRTYIKPSYQRLMRTARDADCIVHVHSDGDLRALMDDLLDCPVDVINLQDLVNGVDWIAEHLAGKICIDLDIDRQHVTVRGTPTEIDALIRREVETIGSKQGGLMMLYGLYPGVPLQNVRAIMDAMEKYSTYYS